MRISLNSDLFPYIMALPNANKIGEPHDGIF